MIGIQPHLPDAPLRTSALAAIASCFLGTVALTFIVHAWIGTGASYVAKAVTLAAALAGAALAGLGPHHPFSRFGPANYVTTARAMGVALIAGLIGEPETTAVAWSAAGAAAAIAALDGVDGWLARRSRMASAFGARFDMETDALLILVLSALVWMHAKAGAWVLLCGLMRYAFVAAGWVLPWLARPLRSTLRGKSVAVAQMVGLTAALAPSVPTPASTSIAAVTLAALVWSFAIDVRWMSRQYRA